MTLIFQLHLDSVHISRSTVI